ncbi:uncharacterized protein TNCV_3100411 [Trichonephila clavipes]|nr:uncharacterized protein TNCV_3100411 [Trichonephila clavipes]
MRRYEVQVEEANSEGSRRSCAKASESDLTCATLVHIIFENLEITTFTYTPRYEASSFDSDSKRQTSCACTMMLFLLPLVGQYQIEAHEINHGKGLVCYVFLLAVTLNTKQMAVWQMAHPNLEGEHPEGGQGPLTSLTLPSTSREDLRLDCYLEYPPPMP